jgi:hypothetical protein
MYTYNDLYKCCDAVLGLFTEKEPRLDQLSIRDSVDFTASQSLAAIIELIDKDCLKKDDFASSNWYIIKAKGLYIKEIGGFKEYLKELNRQDELKKLLDDYSLRTSQSVIDTNALVGQNVRTQERLTKFALLIAVIAAVVPLITLLKDTLCPKPTIDKATISIIKSTQATIDSLKQSLDSINVSLKNSKNVSYKINTTKKK